MFRKDAGLFVFSIAFFFGFFGFSAQGQVPKGPHLVKPAEIQTIVTVGGAQADIPGYTSGAIQLGLDALKTRGGGTLRLSAGTFHLTGPIRLYSDVVIEGAGSDTILWKSDGFKTSFTIDADFGMYKATVADASGFQVGSGIQLYDNLHDQGWDVTTAVITAIDGNVIYFDNSTVNDYLSAENGTISNAFSPIEAVAVANVRIANLVVDGNGSTNDYINGCRGGGVYIHRSRHCIVEGVHVKNFNGDSFSWQITEGITVKDCEASNGRGLGFHPGTGSDGSIVEDNRSHHNAQDGFFLCWRVQNGVFKGNSAYSNERHGISIGHQDTDNLFLDNHVYENWGHGVYFRVESEQNGGHRNTFRNNTIENNGIETDPGYGFYIGGRAHDIIIEGNTIRSTGTGHQRAAVFMGSDAQGITLSGNKISGHEEKAF